MKKFYFIVSLLFLFGCSKKAEAQQVTMEKDVSKLVRVLSSLSDKARNAIPNGDAGELLADLYKVLACDTDDLLILCDKSHSLGKDYVPKDLVPLVKNENYVINKNTLSLTQTAESALAKMALSAKRDGIILDISSSYRSYATQERTFNYWVSVDGLKEAERESARAGTSQHQLGTVVDFGSVDDSFANTKQCAWLNKNASKFGWSLSFPQGYEDVTGYRWECWHFRYIGKEACEFQKKWFSDVQQFMLEFIHAYKTVD